MLRSIARLFLVLPVALCASATVALAQNNVVNQLLAATDERIASQGFERSSVISNGTLRGSLRDSGSETSVVTLRSGVEYVFVGVCDEDCSDLDIILYRSGSSDAVARDLLRDDAPIVRHTPDASGDYRVYVSMADCDVSPCAYAVRIYERAAGASAATVRQAGRSGGTGRAQCLHTTANDVLVVGDDRRGIIGENSCMQPDATPANMYRIDVAERRNVRITMSSTDFDAYLSLYRADGSLIVSNDDGAGGTDAQISLMLAPGTYYVAANVISASSAGTYHLSVR